MKESNIQKLGMIQASEMGTKLFRNNVGKTWIGQAERASTQQTTILLPGDVVIRNARRFHAGLCEGSSDTIGWTPVKITEDMVGKTVAVFTGIEFKTRTGRMRDAQSQFQSNVRQAGGICFPARSIDDVAAGLTMLSFPII